MSTVTCTDLKDAAASGTVVIDVMTPEDYAACHAAGAKNACIYEMVFLDRVNEYVPERSTKLVVYDASGTTRAAEEALERLLRAGYHDVSILKGGLSAWKSAGLPVETGERMPEAELKDGMYLIDTEKSVFEWIGRNLNNRHNGRIAIQIGEMVVQGGELTAGTVVLDMNSITNSDLQDADWRDMLIRHLKSDDFFAVAQYPTASFRLAGWAAEVGAPPEAPHGTVTGELTIRDVTRPITFQATVAPQADGGIKAHAVFDFDRTLWNVCYGSGKLFERLGMHLVHDIITVELFIQARPGCRGN